MNPSSKKVWSRRSAPKPFTTTSIMVKSLDKQRNAMEKRHRGKCTNRSPLIFSFAPCQDTYSEYAFKDALSRKNRKLILYKNNADKINEQFNQIK
jgi:hypothetical protein